MCEGVPQLIAQDSDWHAYVCMHECNMFLVLLSMYDFCNDIHVHVHIMDCQSPNCTSFSICPESLFNGEIGILKY